MATRIVSLLALLYGEQTGQSSGETHGNPRPMVGEGFHGKATVRGLLVGPPVGSTSYPAVMGSGWGARAGTLQPPVRHPNLDPSCPGQGEGSKSLPLIAISFFPLLFPSCSRRLLCTLFPSSLCCVLSASPLLRLSPWAFRTSFPRPYSPFSFSLHFPQNAFS